MYLAQIKNLSTHFFIFGSNYIIKPLFIIFETFNSNLEVSVLTPFGNTVPLPPFTYVPAIRSILLPLFCIRIVSWRLLLLNHDWNARKRKLKIVLRIHC